MITVVYDNNPGEEGLVADWGFSCVVRGFARTILFDTGTRGDVLLHNMGKLGILPSEIGIVVLSHIDYDHTGGLADFLGKAGKVTVFMPAVFPEDFKDGVRRAGATVVETKKAQEVCAGTSTTGVLSGVRDEQALVLDIIEGDLSSPAVNGVFLATGSIPRFDVQYISTSGLEGAELLLMEGGETELARVPLEGREHFVDSKDEYLILGQDNNLIRVNLILR